MMKNKFENLGFTNITLLMGLPILTIKLVFDLNTKNWVHVLITLELIILALVVLISKYLVDKKWKTDERGDAEDSH